MPPLDASALEPAPRSALDLQRLAVEVLRRAVVEQQARVEGPLKPSVRIKEVQALRGLLTDLSVAQERVEVLEAQAQRRSEPGIRRDLESVQALLSKLSDATIAAVLADLGDASSAHPDAEINRSYSPIAIEAATDEPAPLPDVATLGEVVGPVLALGAREKRQRAAVEAPVPESESGPYQELPDGTRVAVRPGGEIPHPWLPVRGHVGHWVPVQNDNER